MCIVDLVVNLLADSFKTIFKVPAMKFHILKQVAFASGIVAGSLFSPDLFAQTNLVTSVTHNTYPCPPSGAPCQAFGTVGAGGVVSSVTTGPGYQQVTGISNVVSLQNGATYTASYTFNPSSGSSTIPTFGNGINVINSSTGVVIQRYLPIGSTTTSNTAAFTGASGSYSIVFASVNPVGGVSFTVSDYSFLGAAYSNLSGGSQTDTQAALLQSADALRSVFNQQSAVVNNSLHYDCTVFAENGVCVSGGGRFATTNSITGEQASTLLVAAYKALSNVRVGMFIDQNVNSANVTGVTLDKNPMYGVFGVWNQNPDAMGYEVRLSTSYANQNISQTRNVVGTSEAGVGSASLTSQALSGVVSYAMPVTDSTWIASPYVGVRKTKINRGGYTETSAVSTPLTYSDLTQDITTALAGVRTSKKYGDDLHVTASVGVEQNVGSNISTLDATGVTGLTATDFSANYAKTRPVASAGASYAIDKNQRISLNAMYRREAFQSSGSTTALLMYQVGL
jgi:uncharacterized protein YhjY with autotransporter beta-barrel domain